MRSWDREGFKRQSLSNDKMTRLVVDLFFLPDRKDVGRSRLLVFNRC